MTESKDLEDVILRRINSTRKTTSFITKMAGAQEPAQSALFPPSPTIASPTPLDSVFAQLINNIGTMLDAKLSPIAAKLDSLQTRVDSCASNMQLKLNPAAASKVMQDIGSKLAPVLETVTLEAKQTIAEGVNFYNNSLKQKEEQYKQEQESTIRIVKETNRGLLETRAKATMVNHERISKILGKINQSMRKNEELLLEANNEIKKNKSVSKTKSESKGLEKYLKMAKEEGIDEGDLEDQFYGELVELSEEDLINILLMNIDPQVDVVLGYGGRGDLPKNISVPARKK